MIHFHAQGRGPVLLLVHGLGADRSDWQPVADRLSADFNTLLFDLPGQGEAVDQPLPESLAELAQRIWAALDRWGIGQLALAGHSLGGAVVLEMLRQRPYAVSAAVLVCSLPSFRPETLRARVEFGMRRVLACLLGPVGTAYLGAWRMFPQPEQAAQREAIIARGRRNSRRSYLHYLNLLRRWSCRDALASMRRPLLWAIAGRDYFPPAAVREAIAPLPDVEVVEFAQAGHGLPMQMSAELAEAMREFLRRRLAGNEAERSAEAGAQ